MTRCNEVVLSMLVMRFYNCVIILLVGDVHDGLQGGAADESLLRILEHPATNKAILRTTRPLTDGRWRDHGR